MNNKIKLLVGALIVFGMTGPANADCETGLNDPSSYTLLIDGSSTCENLGGNFPMYGCEVDSAGNCFIDGGNGNTITIKLGNGSTVGGTTPIDWSITSNPTGGLVDLGILVGANNGGSCGTNYAPGSDFGEGLIFRKTNGSGQKVNKLFFCSDFIQPLTGEPRLIVTKTVTTSTGSCSNPDTSTDSLEIGAGDIVQYCYKVENVGLGRAEAVTLCDDAGTPTPGGVCDPGAPDSDDFMVINLGPLNGGGLDPTGIAMGSEMMVIAAAGTVVNTATASATGGVTATDTATVTAVQVAQVSEICPDGYQDAANQEFGSDGEDLDYAFILDPQQGDRVSVCAPKNLLPNGKQDPSQNNAFRVQCIDQCLPPPICLTDPTDPACINPTPPVCQSSGVWTTEVGGICGPVEDPPPGAHPYCWEVQQDLDKDCIANAWEPQGDTVLHIKRGHVNPYVYQSCYSSGGRYVCETMCFSFSAADALACPPGSTVF